jgi:polysaccharide deacetylase 2 family uncharacterized protein YibQ
MSKPSGLASVQTTRGLAVAPTATLSSAAAMAARRGFMFIVNPLQSVERQKTERSTLWVDRRWKG